MLIFYYTGRKPVLPKQNRWLKCAFQREKNRQQKKTDFLGDTHLKVTWAQKEFPQSLDWFTLIKKKQKKKQLWEIKYIFSVAAITVGEDYLSNAIPTHPLLMLSHEPLAPQQHELKTRVNDLLCSVVVHSGLGTRIIWLWFGIKTQESKRFWYLFRLFWES